MITHAAMKCGAPLGVALSLIIMGVIVLVVAL